MLYSISKNESAIAVDEGERRETRVIRSGNKAC
jgi:hypothetical protein